MKNAHLKTDYVSYNAYPLNNIVNINMDRLLIQQRATIKLKMTTTKYYWLQFQLSYICYSNLHIHKQMRNLVLDLHNDHPHPQNYFNDCNMSKNSNTKEVISDDFILGRNMDK